MEKDGKKADNYTNGRVINYSMEDYDMFRKVRKIKNEITTEEAKELLSLSSLKNRGKAHK